MSISSHIQNLSYDATLSAPIVMVMVISLLVLILFILIQLTHRKVDRTKQKNKKLCKVLDQVLKMG